MKGLVLLNYCLLYNEQYLCHVFKCVFIWAKIHLHVNSVIIFTIQAVDFFISQKLFDSF